MRINLGKSWDLANSIDFLGDVNYVEDKIDGLDH